MADFVPKQDNARYVWLTNLKTNLPKHVPEIDITPARLAQVNAWVNELLAALALVRQKRDEWLAASAQKKLTARRNLAGLRKEIARWKTSSNGSTGAIAGLQLSAPCPRWMPIITSRNWRPGAIPARCGCGSRSGAPPM